MQCKQSESAGVSLAYVISSSSCPSESMTLAHARQQPITRRLQNRISVLHKQACGAKCSEASGCAKPSPIRRPSLGISEKGCVRETAQIIQLRSIVRPCIRGVGHGHHLHGHGLRSIGVGVILHGSRVLHGGCRHRGHWPGIGHSIRCIGHSLRERHDRCRGPILQVEEVGKNALWCRRPLR